MNWKFENFDYEICQHHGAAFTKLSSGDRDQSALNTLNLERIDDRGRSGLLLGGDERD